MSASCDTLEPPERHGGDGGDMQRPAMSPNLGPIRACSKLLQGLEGVQGTLDPA